MSDWKYTGRKFRVAPERIELHGLPGFYSGPNWVLGMNLVEGHGVYTPCEVEPVSIFALVVRQIGYVSAERVPDIAAIHLSNRLAVCLFLEGALDVYDFARAYKEDGRVIVPSVSLAGSVYTLVIWPEWVLFDDCIPVDKQGNILDLGQLPG